MGVSRVSLLTNHAEALLCVARAPGMRIRDAEPVKPDETDWSGI